MTQDEVTKNVMDILAQDDVPWKQIGLYVAKNAPHLFIRACEAPEPFWAKHVRNILQDNYYGGPKGRVAAIKAVRALTGNSLRMSKELVDEFIKKEEMSM